MAHYNDSWDLPPLVGSCYMYGPQKEGLTNEQSLAIVKNLRIRDTLGRIQQQLQDIHLSFAWKGTPEDKETANLLVESLECLRAVSLKLSRKIPVDLL